MKRASWRLADFNILSEFLVPILIAELLILALYRGGWTVGGLFCDIVGALFLVWGQLKGPAAHLVYLQNADGGMGFWSEFRKQRLHAKIAMWLGAKLGSRDIMEANQRPPPEEFAANAWGIAFLIVGFLLQAIGAYSD